MSSAGAQFASAVLGFGTNVIYARALGLTEVGTIALALAAGMVAVVFCDRGLGTWVTRNVPAGHATLRDAARLLGRGAVVPLLVTALVWAMVSVTGIADESAAYLRFLFPVAGAFWLFQTGLSLTQAADRPHLRSASILTNAGVTLAGSTVVAIINPTVELFIVSSIAGYVIAALLVFWALRSQIRPAAFPVRPIDLPLAQRQSLPLFGSNLLTYAMGAADVLILAIFASSADVGLYQVAKKVAQAVSLPWTSVVPVVIGRLASRSSTEVSRALRQFAGAGSLYYLVAAIALFIAGAESLSLIFGNNFAASAPTLIALVLSYLVQLYRDATGANLVLTGRYGRSFWGQVAAVCAFLLSTPALTSMEGALGFAVSLGIGFAVGTLTNLFLQRPGGRKSST